MRDKVNYERYRAGTNTENSAPKAQAPIDPDLHYIRSVIDGASEQTSAKTNDPARDNKAKRNTDTPDQALKPSLTATATNWVVAHLAAFLRRPDAPKILSVLLLLTLFALQPGLVTFMVVLALMLALILFFSFGPDKVQDWIVRRYEKLRERDPDAAERTRRRAAEASKRLSTVVEKLPENWTAGLYLPDFEEPEELPEKFKSDPFDRLDGQKDQRSPNAGSYRFANVMKRSQRAFRTAHMSKLQG